MLTTPPLFHNEPAGSPADDVGSAVIKTDADVTVSLAPLITILFAFVACVDP